MISLFIKIQLSDNSFLSSSLKKGKLGHVGNVIGMPNELEDICTVLPRLPKDLPILILETQGQRKLEFKVRHQKLKAALIYLKHNNPAYADVQISEENLEEYKYFDEKGRPIEGLPTQSYDTEEAEEFLKLDDEVMHEADAVLESELNGDFPAMATTVHEIIRSKDNDTLTKDAINQAGAKQVISEEAKQKEIRFDKPKQKKEPASEFMDWYYR